MNRNLLLFLCAAFLTANLSAAADDLRAVPPMGTSDLGNAPPPDIQDAAAAGFGYPAFGPPPPSGDAFSLPMGGPPPPMDYYEMDPAATAATVTCPYPDGRCFSGPQHSSPTQPIPLEQAVQREAVAIQHEENSVSECYGNHLVEVAKKRTARRFTSFSGMCAQKVNRDMAASGEGNGFSVHPGNIDGAIQYWRLPHKNYGLMDQLGWTDVTKQYDENTAPTGAVLVFAGPLTASYEEAGHVPPGPHRSCTGKGKNRHCRRIAGSRGAHKAGDWLGHITIKSTPGDGYLTDGHTAHAAVKGRRLVGVYILKHCEHCSAALKRQCGDN